MTKAKEDPILAAYALGKKARKSRESDDKKAYDQARRTYLDMLEDLPLGSLERVTLVNAYWNGWYLDGEMDNDF